MPDPIILDDDGNDNTSILQVVFPNPSDLHLAGTEPGPGGGHRTQAEEADSQKQGVSAVFILFCTK